MFPLFAVFSSSFSLSVSSSFSVVQQASLLVPSFVTDFNCIVCLCMICF